MNEKKKQNRANKQPPPPPTFIEWLAFSCIKHEENDKMSKGLASKVFIMEVATTLQFHVHRSISEVRVLHMPTSRTVSSGVSE